MAQCLQPRLKLAGRPVVVAQVDAFGGPTIIHADKYAARSIAGKTYPGTAPRNISEAFGRSIDCRSAR